MGKGYALIADGLKMMAQGYELLAGAGGVENAPETQSVEQVAEAQVVSDTPQVEAPKEAVKETPKVSVADVRAVMRQKIKDGKMEQCQEILHSFGCDKLTDVAEDKLSELLSKVEVL